VERRLLVFALICLLSLFADITYEGARSVVGPYLETLGATAIIAGITTVGEFLGYVARLGSGLAISRRGSSRALWGAALGGYALNLLSVPALSLATNWGQVLGLVYAERVGKGLRAPAINVVLAEVSEGIGRGKGFGIHEIADQAGGVVGPIIVGAILAATSSYRITFAALAVPAAISLAIVFAARSRYPVVKSVEARENVGSGGAGWRSLGPGFRRFVAGMAVMALGYAPWTLVSYYAALLGIASPSWIAAMYALAMGVDGCVALGMGWLYDRLGTRVVALAPVFAAPTALFFLSPSKTMLVATAALWGAALGVVESAAKASVADLVEPSARPLAYGLYGFVFGACWMACGALFGWLCSFSPRTIPAVSMPLLGASTAILAMTRRGGGK